MSEGAINQMTVDSCLKALEEYHGKLAEKDAEIARLRRRGDELPLEEDEWTESEQEAYCQGWSEGQELLKANMDNSGGGDA